MSTVKESCDGEDIIVRAYESQGKRTAVEFTLGWEAESVTEVDLMEQTEYARVTCNDRCFRAEFKPFEIKTFRIIGRRWECRN